MGANQNARKLLSTDLVNTNIRYECQKPIVMAGLKNNNAKTIAQCVAGASIFYTTFNKVILAFSSR